MSTPNTSMDSSANAVCPVQHKTPVAPSSSGCPVDHKNMGKGVGSAQEYPDACPMSGANTAYKFLEHAPAFPEARRKVETADESVVGDIFPDSKPIFGQRYKLSTIPSASNIPKSERNTGPPSAVVPPTAPQVPEHLRAVADKVSPPVCTSDEAGTPGMEGKEETWTFPSPQRFYNAMKKKGWNPDEVDIPYIVSVHNTVNQAVWRDIMLYEKYHEKKCATPKLLRFQGRPTDLSPKAQILNFMGYTLPYDRHDWTIDRCGEDVRYVIDFYDGQIDPRYPVSTHIDARPALDSPSAFIDRIRRWIDSKFEM